MTELWLLRHGETPWTVWDDGAPGGETPSEVGIRADRVIERATSLNGAVALFAHGHLLRALAAGWLGWPAEGGGALTLDTASVCVLAMERERRALKHWNEICHLSGER